MKLYKLTLVLPILSASIPLERRTPGLLDQLLNNSVSSRLIQVLGIPVDGLSKVVDKTQLGYLTGNLALEDITELLGYALSPLQLNSVLHYLISDKSQERLNEVVNNLKVSHLTEALHLDIEELVAGLQLEPLNTIVKVKKEEDKVENPSEGSSDESAELAEPAEPSE